MKKRIFLVIALLLSVISCNEPETIVTDCVGRDGSVVRKAELKNKKNELALKDFAVPVDSTWKLHDSLSISEEGDTTWFLLAEKLFKSADEINKVYLADTGKNSNVARSAFFEHKFKWFTTSFYFSEKCGKSLDYGYPAVKFLSSEEIEFMKMPPVKWKEMLAGPDSLRYAALSDSIDEHSTKWMDKSVVSEWIEETGALCIAAGKDTVVKEILRAHEAELEAELDTLFLLNPEFSKSYAKIIGDSIFEKFQPELDSALRICDKKIDRFISFKEYTMQIVMPEKVKSSNGYLMPGGEVAWAVQGELFLTDDYIMWAETKEVNYWAIFLTALVLLVIPFEIKNHSRKKPGKKE
jgi:hypothetical protein